MLEQFGEDYFISICHAIWDGIDRALTYRRLPRDFQSSSRLSVLSSRLFCLQSYFIKIMFFKISLKYRLIRFLKIFSIFFIYILFRATRKSDLVMPDQARAVARELGVCYYETSVFTYYGVNEVFENSIRAALIARRQQRFWMTNLKRVQRPLLQVYFLP